MVGNVSDASMTAKIDKSMKRLPLPGERGRKTFLSIQYLRAFAAISVLIFHATTTDGYSLFGWTGFYHGHHGVDVFFVISGFIMFTAARGEGVANFLLARLFRIYPLYWIALLLTVILSLCTTSYGLSGRELFASILLWPRYSFGHPDQIWPILVPGWTLTYELFFYIVFAIGISLKRVVMFPTTFLIALIGMGLVVDFKIAPMVVATNPILAEFVVGLWIGVIVSRRTLSIPSVAVAWGVLALSFWLLNWTMALVMANAAGIVATALAMEPVFQRKKFASLKLLGDASYSIYLVHVLVLGLPQTFFPDKFINLDVISRGSLVLFMIFSAIATGIVVHLMIEKPIVRNLRPVSMHIIKILTQNKIYDNSDSVKSADT
ncbi:acyltransferase [bacterium]|nr:MAG: acyltransferase [bacterium]